MTDEELDKLYEPKDVKVPGGCDCHLPPMLIKQPDGRTVARIDRKVYTNHILAGHNSEHYFHMGLIIMALERAMYRRGDVFATPTHIAVPRWIIEILTAVGHPQKLYGYKTCESENDDIFLAYQYEPPKSTNGQSSSA